MELLHTVFPSASHIIWRFWAWIFGFPLQILQLSFSFSRSWSSANSEAWKRFNAPPYLLDFFEELYTANSLLNRIYRHAHAFWLVCHFIVYKKLPDRTIFLTTSEHFCERAHFILILTKEISITMQLHASINSLKKPKTEVCYRKFWNSWYTDDQTTKTCSLKKIDHYFNNFRSGNNFRSENNFRSTFHSIRHFLILFLFNFCSHDNSSFYLYSIPWFYI